MSDIETAIKASRQIEDLLEIHFHAKGRGLHEKLTSVERQLSVHILKRARYIASVRNAVVHDDNAIIRDRAGFDAAKDEIVAYLKQSNSPPRKSVALNKPSNYRPKNLFGAILRGALTATLIFIGAILIGFVILAIQANMANSPDSQNTTGPARPVELPQIR